MMAAYRVEGDLLGVADFAPLRRTVAHIAASESVFLGSLAGGALIGAAEMEVAEAEPANIAALVVMPSHFRKGVGRALVRRVLEWCDGRDVTVSTGIRNAPALELYAGLGFRESRRWRTDDGIRMVTLRYDPSTTRGGKR